LDEPSCRFFVHARHALFAGVGALGLAPGDQVLVPAYHHGAEVEALLQAGVECVFYGATPDLEPDPEELAGLAGPRCRALYLIHVLGFGRDAARWRRWCDERGMLLIEDASQAWLATVNGAPVGSHGDLTVYGLSDALPLPSLSVALCDPAVAGAAALRIPHGGRDEVAAARAWLRTVPSELTGALHQSELWRRFAGAWRRPTTPAASDFHLGDTTVRPGPDASLLLSRLAVNDAARARRENYRILLSQLGDVVPAPFGELPEGASPFAFPVEVNDKAALLRRLADNGIDGLDWWPTHHPSVPLDSAATAARRRRSTVALPVHQRLSTSDLERVAEAVRPPRRHEDLSIEHVDDLDALRSEWTALAQQTHNVFASWEWHRTWWDHFGRDRPLAVTALRDGSGALRAVLPLYLWAERPLRIARFIGNTAGDQLGPICVPGDEAVVGRAMRRLLSKPGWDLLLGEQLPAQSGWGKRLSGQTVSREGSPIVRFGVSWEETSGRWSRGLRKELRRDDRRLRERHEVQIRTITERDQLEESLTTFFELHRSRWKEGTKFERREAFHRDFATRAFEKGWLRLRLAEVDCNPAAARLGFRLGAVESGYQAGWDAKYAEYSIGILLLADTIRAAHDDGMKEYRFLRGGEAYKYRFANADPGLETVVLARDSMSGLAAGGVTIAGSRLPQYLRSKVTNV
jgi:dTDP-4-amino-4,6-dideoxygalactose transaminase/CelD/BcsL family acetyltransferase involved in cellulose biosynthesis